MQNKKKIGIVIPIVHPAGKKVKDYSRIEFILYQTLRSLSGINCAFVKILVLCHQLPAWAAEFQTLVDFIDVGERECFSPNSTTVQIDKGLKYLIGITHLLQKYELDFVIPMDGDDFLRSNLLDRLESHSDLTQDGYIIEEGFHVSLGFTGEKQLRIAGVFKVKEFHETCGSCRIFRGEAIRKHVITAFGKTWFNKKMLDNRAEQNSSCSVLSQYRVSESIIAELTAWTKKYCDEFDTLVHALGRHVKQERQFKFIKIRHALAAKGCGHDNHDGPRRGEVHWFRMIGWWTVSRFGRQFFIQNQPSVKLRTDWLLILKAYVWRHQQRNLLSPPTTRT